jgi:hypothetical protein
VAPVACAAVANDSGVHPGWYADPLGRFELRYYNGAAWTADVSSDGDRFVDPLGIELGTSCRHSRRWASRRSAPNGPATAAMVLGIIAVAIAWLPFIVVLGVIAAVLALVFGAVGNPSIGRHGRRSQPCDRRPRHRGLRPGRRRARRRPDRRGARRLRRLRRPRPARRRDHLVRNRRLACDRLGHVGEPRHGACRLLGPDRFRPPRHRQRAPHGPRSAR